MVENFDKVKEHMTDISNATGSAKEMYGVYADSVQAKINDLKRAFENLYDKIMTSDGLKGFINTATQFITFLTSIDGNTWKLIATFTTLGLVLKSLGTFSMALKGVSSIVELGKEAGLIGNLVGWFGRLGASISGLATASLAFIATPLGATLTGLTLLIGGSIATYTEYKDLMSKPIATTSTENLNGFQKVINSLTGNTIKSKQELQDAGLAYEDFSSSLSDKFKNGVEDASQSFNKLKTTLTFDDIKSDTFTDSMSQDVKTQIDSIVNKAKQAVEDKRSDMQDTMTQLFTLNGEKINGDQESAMSALSDYENEKFNTVQDLNQKIYNVLNKAVEEHRKLTEDDVNNIKNYTQQIQAIQIQANAQNESDNEYASNQEKFSKRLNSMTPSEALDSAKEAYNQIVNIGQESEDKEKEVINKSKNLKEDLQNSLNEAVAKGDTSEATKLSQSIKTIEDSITKAQDNLNDEVKKRQDKTKELWDAFYQANPNLQGKINEVNFSEFTKNDLNSQGDLSKMESQLNGLADASQSGMQRIKDANGNWHDVEVTVDEATGHIISAYDTTNGKFGGYSEDFAKKSEQMYKTMYESQEKIKTLMNTSASWANNGSSFKLDEGNNFTYTSSDGITESMEKMEKVIQLSSGYKEAIANINGTQIKMEFDKDGTLQNYQDVISAINGNKDSKAIVNVDVNDKDALDRLKELENLKDKLKDNTSTKISIDGTDTKNITDAINALEKLPKDSKAKITIDGTDVDNVDEAIKKLKEIPTETTTKITINGEEVSTVDDAKKKLDEIAQENPNAKISINGEQIATIDEAKQKLDNIPPNTNTEIKADNSDANSKAEDTTQKMGEVPTETNTTMYADNTQAMSALDDVIGKMEYIATHPVESVINVVKNFTNSGNDTSEGASVTAKDNNEASGDNDYNPQIIDPQYNATGTNSFDGSSSNGWTWINEGDKGELVTLPDGTQIIPHDLSEKIVGENSNKSQVVNNQIEVSVTIPNVYGAKKVSAPVPEDNDGGYFPSLQGGGASDSTSKKSKKNSSKSTSSSSSKEEKKAEQSSKKAEQAEKKAEKIKAQIDDLQSDLDIDRFVTYNNAVTEADNALNSNKTLMESLDQGSTDYQKAQLQEIELYKQKRDALAQLSMQQELDADDRKNQLAQYSFYFDEQGRLINGNQRLLEIQESINAESGTTEEEKKQKQDDIKWLKELKTKTEEYNKLVEETMPKTSDEWNQLNNEIKKVNDTMTKTWEESVTKLRDELVQDYLKEQQDKVDAMKKDAQKAEEDAKTALENEKQAKLDEWDEKIKDKQAELDALNDESDDNKTKLKKLQNELSLWKKDNSVFAKSKIESLNTQITDLQKTIKKDTLSKDIKDLNEDKQNDSDDYDKKIKKQEELNKKQEELAEQNYKNMTNEKKAYQHIDELITKNQQNEMIRLLGTYGDSYKQVGTILGKNFTNAFQDEISKVQSSIKALKGDYSELTTTTNNSYSDNSSGSSSSSFVAKNGDHVWLYDAEENEIYSDPSHNNSKGTAWSNGVASADELVATGYKNGFMRVSDSNGNDLGYVENDKLKKFASGGRIGNVGSQGSLVIADDNEMIANANDTKKFDEMYNYIKNSGSILSQLSLQMSSSNNYINPMVGTDLNNITNGVINNNSTNNTNASTIHMPVTIVNEKGAEQFTEQKLYKAMDKWQKEQGRRYR